MKNILIIIASLKHGGGAEKVATTIGSSLYEKGYNIHFFTFYHVKDKYEFRGKYYSLNEKLSKNHFINIIKLLVRAYEIQKYCKKNDIDISISHMTESNFSNILSKLLFVNKSKIIIQLHASLHILPYLYKIGVKYLYPHSDKIITIVKEEKNNLIVNYKINKKKIQTIYNPIDLKQINLLKEDDLGEYKKYFTSEKFTFINIGRLNEAKNHKLLLNCFDQINQKYNNTQLLILGEGELKKQLQKQQEKLKSKKAIFFLGKHKNIFNFLKTSDCFVLSSSWEGLPVTLLESMGCLLPIISTDCKTGPKEILRNKIKNYYGVTNTSIEKYGILVPINNEKELFIAMEKIILNKELREKYKKRYQKKSLSYDINKIIKIWEKII